MLHLGDFLTVLVVLSSRAILLIHVSERLHKQLHIILFTVSGHRQGDPLVEVLAGLSACNASVVRPCNSLLLMIHGGPYSLTVFFFYFGKAYWVAAAAQCPTASHKCSILTTAK